MLIFFYTYDILHQHQGLGHTHSTEVENFFLIFFLIKLFLHHQFHLMAIPLAKQNYFLIIKNTYKYLSKNYLKFF